MCVCTCTGVCNKKYRWQEKKVVSMFYLSIYLLIYKTFKRTYMCVYTYVKKKLRDRHTHTRQWLTSDLFPLNSHEFMCVKKTRQTTNHQESKSNGFVMCMYACVCVYVK